MKGRDAGGGRRAKPGVHTPEKRRRQIQARVWPGLCVQPLGKPAPSPKGPYRNRNDTSLFLGTGSALDLYRARPPP